MKDEAEDGLLYEAQSKLTSRRLPRRYTCAPRRAGVPPGPEATWMLQVPSHSAVRELGLADGGVGGTGGRMCARLFLVPIPSSD